jgi:hypothetical protein
MAVKHSAVHEVTTPATFMQNLYSVSLFGWINLFAGIYMGKLNPLDGHTTLLVV